MKSGSLFLDRSLFDGYRYSLKTVVFLSYKNRLKMAYFHGFKVCVIFFVIKLIRLYFHNNG